MEILNDDCIYNILTYIHPYYSISLSRTCKLLHNIINSELYHNYLINVYMNNPRLIGLHRTQLMLIILYTNPIKESMKYYINRLDDLLHMSLKSKSNFEDILGIINCHQKMLEHKKKKRRDSIINFAYQLVGKKRETPLDDSIVSYIIRYNRNDLCYQYLGISCREALIKLLKSGSGLTNYMGCLEFGINLISIICYVEESDIINYVIWSRDIISLYKYNPEILELSCLEEMKLGFNFGFNDEDVIDKDYKYPSLLLAGYLIGSSMNNNICTKVKLMNINKIRMMGTDVDVSTQDTAVRRSRRNSKIYNVLSEEEIILYREICGKEKDVLGVKEYYNSIFTLFLSSRSQYDKMCRIMYKEYVNEKDWKLQASHFTTAWVGIEDILVAIRNIPDCTLYCIQSFIERTASERIVEYIKKHNNL
ncbi:F-box domain-containing protein with Leucine-rich repeat [Orpheovirus IHUMI-LCC2]|uniref:F-box domain-containing protein with Leucine-rich repeat n=1 Tax=Orpheovirus IHUMI-LCC2 TaxID=2023057 RepID=A0A2I2L437_9VIRU|nr:F-box domain-containing protein with Leucine-rich repeat [Orpheovirus IHUMI-LCC2]SNW62306.1 F-box domain-containing protein with Leucine-rich repeat [Orpheovirus IHUMI-LCC2]